MCNAHVDPYGFAWILIYGCFTWVLGFYAAGSYEKLFVCLQTDEL